jgi:CheY-like chemotaxis protein
MSVILLVEDNELNWDMLSRRLGRKGYQVIVATDGQQGLDMARSEAPDLILMDMSLPVVDGWEATRRLKAAPETRSIPIIALTAHAMTGDRQEALDAAMIMKASRSFDLLGKIQHFLGRAGES